MPMPHPFPGRPHEYLNWHNVRIDRHPDMTYELHFPALFWPGQVDATWVLFRDAVDERIAELLGNPDNLIVNMEMATVSGTRENAKIEEWGKLRIRSSRDVIAGLAFSSAAEAFAQGLGDLADECGAQSSSYDEQDGRLATDIGATFKAYAERTHAQ